MQSLLLLRSTSFITFISVIICDFAVVNCLVYLLTCPEHGQTTERDSNTSIGHISFPFLHRSNKLDMFLDQCFIHQCYMYAFVCSLVY